MLPPDRAIHVWIDGVLRQPLHPNPLARHESLSEFVHDLRHPNPAFPSQARPPLIERHPVRFWKGVSALLALIVVALLSARFGGR